MNPDAQATLKELKRIGGIFNTESEILDRAADLVVAYLRAKPESTPRTQIMAASALYMSSVMWGKPISQKAASEAVGASPGTVNRGYRRMAKILFPNVGECCDRKGGKDEPFRPEVPAG